MITEIGITSATAPLSRVFQTDHKRFATKFLQSTRQFAAVLAPVFIGLASIFLQPVLFGELAFDGRLLHLSQCTI